MCKYPSYPWSNRELAPISYSLQFPLALLSVSQIIVLFIHLKMFCFTSQKVMMYAICLS